METNELFQCVSRHQIILEILRDFKRYGDQFKIKLEYSSLIGILENYLATPITLNDVMIPILCKERILLLNKVMQQGYDQIFEKTTGFTPEKIISEYLDECSCLNIKKLIHHVIIIIELKLLRYPLEIKLKFGNLLILKKNVENLRNIMIC